MLNNTQYTYTKSTHDSDIFFVSSSLLNFSKTYDEMHFVFVDQNITFLIHLKGTTKIIHLEFRRVELYMVIRGQILNVQR